MGLYTSNHFGNRTAALLMGLVMILFMLSFSDARGQKDSLRLLKKDISPITIKHPSKETLNDILTDRDYQYENDPEPPDNPFAKWIEWIWRKIGSFFTGKSYENFWQYVLMLGMLSLFIFLLYKAKVLNYVLPSRQSASQLDYEVGQENIHEINFEQVIEEAVGGGDYRLGVRLQYLKTLRVLSDSQIIRWKPDRTNASYADDLRNYAFYLDFLRLTRYFEFAWYGDFSIDQQTYDEMKGVVDSFFIKLTQQPAVYV